MRKKFLEQNVDLPPDESLDHFWQLAYERGEVNPRALATVNGFEGHLLSKHALDGRLSAVSPLALSGISESSNPGADHPGFFHDSRVLNPSAAMPTTLPVRRRTVAEETCNNSFHDSESEDIYDLYNACNGIVRDDGLLDIRELDALSQEEAEALNVVRLKEIWAHTSTGCSTCQEIVQILNSVRGTLRADTEDSFGQIKGVDTNVIDSIS